MERQVILTCYNLTIVATSKFPPFFPDALVLIQTQIDEEKKNH